MKPKGPIKVAYNKLLSAVNLLGTTLVGQQWVDGSPEADLLLEVSAAIEKYEKRVFPTLGD